MPQFDHNTYSSQIFWLIISFAILYFVVAKIVLPRILDTISARDSNINNNTYDAAEFQREASELNSKSSEIRSAANLEFEKAIDAAKKTALFAREETMNHLKERIDQLKHESNSRIENFNSSSTEESKNIQSSLSNKITNKLFG